MPLHRRTWCLANGIDWVSSSRTTNEPIRTPYRGWQNTTYDACFNRIAPPPRSAVVELLSLSVSVFPTALVTSMLSRVLCTFFGFLFLLNLDNVISSPWLFVACSESCFGLLDFDLIQFMNLFLCAAQLKLHKSIFLSLCGFLLIPSARPMFSALSTTLYVGVRSSS